MYQILLNGLEEMIQDLNCEDFPEISAVDLIVENYFDVLGLFPEEKIISTENLNLKIRCLHKN